MKNIRTNALFLPDFLSKAAPLHQPKDIIFFSYDNLSRNQQQKELCEGSELQGHYLADSRKTPFWMSSCDTY